MDKPKKNKFRFLLKITLIVIFGFSLWWLWDYTGASNFPIRNVKVYATYEHVDKGSLQDSIDSYLASGFFHLNVIGLKQQLLKLPWVFEVSIRRNWPDTVTVCLVEQKAFLCWGNQALINTRGEVFSVPVSSFPKDLPVVFGKTGQETEMFNLYRKMLALLEPLDLTIRKLTLNQLHYFEVQLSNGATVYLKEEKPLEQIELLVSLYRKVTAGSNKEPKTIDLRYNSGMAVRWELMGSSPNN